MTYQVGLTKFLADCYKNQPDDQRLGQFMFNSLELVRPELSYEVRGSMLDPFYQDSNIPAFLAFLYENWN